MKVEKRTPRSYKAKEKPYYKAVRRAWKENRTLAEVVEYVVGMYAEGAPAVVFGAIPIKQPKK